MSKQTQSLPADLMRMQDGESSWAEIKRLHHALGKAARLMILLGIKALQLREALPYGQFNRELAEQCPEIGKRSLYRYMRSAEHVIALAGGSCDTRVTTGVLAQMETALRGAGEPELLAEIDALIQGKSGRQLVLEAKQAKEATHPTREPEAEEWCLNHFAAHANGPRDEEDWRFEAELGEITWQQCKQNCQGRMVDMTPPPPDSAEARERLYKLAKSGVQRITQWGTKDEFDRLEQWQRDKLLALWEEGFASLHPSLRLVAIAQAESKTGGRK